MNLIYEEAQFAIIGWKNTDMYDDTKTRIALHPIENGNLQQEIPFTKQSATSIFSIFEDYKHIPKHFEGLIPQNVHIAKDIETQGIKLIWSKNKATQKLFFQDKELNEQNYHLPNLVFKLINTSLSVYAYHEILTAETPLYHAPLYNIYENGVICLGNLSLKPIANFQTFEAVIHYIEHSFFNSQFTHSNNTHITKTYIEQYQQHKQKLIPNSLTFQNIL